MVRALIIVVGLVFSPCIVPLFLLNMIHAFQLLYVRRFRVVNRLARPVWVTPVGLYKNGAVNVATQFAFALPAVPTLFEKNRLVKPRQSKQIFFDRKGMETYTVVVQNEAGEFRQLVIDGSPLRPARAFDEDEFVLDDWNSLPRPTDDVLAATRTPDRGWWFWAYILFGFAACFGYDWLATRLAILSP